MKLGLLAFALVALFCACANGVEYDPISNVASDAAPPVVQTDAGSPIVTPIADAAVDTKPIYNPCAVKVDKATVYPRLTEKVCTDSLGQSYLDGFWDSDLKLMCRFRLSCDMKTRCLPENEQSSPEYANDSCTDTIAMVEFKNGTPVEPYVGLDKYASNTDAGDAGWYSCVETYSIGRAWVDNGMMYYLSLEDGSWVCNPTYINFPGLKLYHLGSLVDPGIFVEQ